MASGIGRRSNWLIRTLIINGLIPALAIPMAWFSENPMYRHPAKSARDAVRACFDIDAPQGEFLYMDGSQKAETSEVVKDAAKRKALWEYGRQAAGFEEGDLMLRDWL